MKCVSLSDRAQKCPIARLGLSVAGANDMYFCLHQIHAQTHFKTRKCELF